ncbi:SprT family zinc-dependent metalloprotease [Methylotuvimicrobium sp. KM2]|uniref:M48 family metallopeptidase n=1 Tax=Methylotuvimicrobium sp. KM2 TaxID=3133976 RepID=UPI003101038B
MLTEPIRDKTISSLPFTYQIRRSSKATKARITVAPGKVQVVAPAGISERTLHRFVEQKQQWVIQALNRLEARVQQVESLAPEFYIDGVDIPYQGERYRLNVMPTRLKRVKLEFFDRFIAHVPEAMPSGDHSEAIRDALIRWMKIDAKLKTEHYVERHKHRHLLSPRSISIRSQKSRWGSCGIHNDIHLNWLLILAPPEVFEYVVVHELCHIKVRNHSSSFWQLVADHLPDYRQRRNWLKEQGSRLMMGL